jgi:hypothetical protein
MMTKSRWPEHVIRREETTNAYRNLIEKPKWKKPLGRPRRRWVSNIMNAF